MISFDFSAPQVQAAIITGTASIISATIGAIAARLIGQVLAGRRKLQDNLETAIDDIAFLLEVERLHCRRNQEQLGESLKNTTREQARRSGVKFSGRFTPGRVRAMDLS